MMVEVKKVGAMSDFIYWYKKQAPKYGYFRSIFDCWFNSRHYNRDGSYK